MPEIDLWYGVIMMFVIAVVIAVAFILYNAINGSGIPAMFATNPEAAKAMPAMTATLNIFDTIFLLVFLSIALSGVVSAFLLESHPIMFIALLVINIVLIIVSAVFGNAFWGFINGLGTVGNQMPTTVWVMRNMPILSLISMIVAGIFAAKFRNSGGGQQ